VLPRALRAGSFARLRSDPEVDPYETRRGTFTYHEKMDRPALFARCAFTFSRHVCIDTHDDLHHPAWARNPHRRALFRRKRTRRRFERRERRGLRPSPADACAISLSGDKIAEVQLAKELRGSFSAANISTPQNSRTPGVERQAAKKKALARFAHGKCAKKTEVRALPFLRPLACQ